MVNNNSSKEHSTASSTAYGLQKGGIPRIPLDMWQHKLPLGITTVLLMTLNGWLPVCLYFILKDGGHLSNTVAVTVPSVVFGVFSYYSAGKRFYSLLRKNSNSRPIGATKRHLDFFMMNFIFLFVAETLMIAIGSSLAGNENETKAKDALRVVSMAIPLIMVVVSIELVGVWLAMCLSPRMHYPMRFSSMTSKNVMRPAVFTIIEDVVAVDGEQGTAYRHALSERYEYSEDIRALMKWADAAWGITGLLVGAGCIVVSWVVHTNTIGWIVGWAAPWVWAWTLTLTTIYKTKSALRKENERYGAMGSPAMGSPDMGASPNIGASPNPNQRLLNESR